MNGPIIYFIVATGILNLIRISIYLISSDWYSLLVSPKLHKPRKRYTPLVSVIVPAYNEALVIKRNLKSLVNSDYPKSKLEIIAVNDGSTDNTGQVIEDFIHGYQGGFKIWLVNKQNGGKAEALNIGISQYARGRIIMCLDADSSVHPQAIRNGVQAFRDRRVIGAASNVNILEDGTLFGLAQRFEYLVCYQMKKSQSILGTEYIIGGIGSMFRRTAIERVGFYDSNTMTEDIDLTVKIIAAKKKHQKLIFVSDFITYTECVHSMKALIRQRYRWKYGRMQTFLKHPQLFFSRADNHAKRLSWFMLPLALFQDLLFFAEPFSIGFILYTSIRYLDSMTILAAMSVICMYILVNVWATKHLSILQRLRLTFYAPAMYILLYMLSFAEYVALIKSLRHLPKLRRSIAVSQTRWQSPERIASS
jgi:biofilm PGA synthesis N-glycosyltransferase PgaC